ncbi:heme-binding domain-containing protein [Pararcticibacter amylolyticus]|uniref:Cytochrome C n=1 Tax=Pararcticibacter amylolyticus TaxID=2173175 RepID=A0A2U2PAS0_9SPHI|nr:heme-binding domain-containing protein [Pararcticibacter amylolyticus]PWG78455.1 cytochrome C [Pararcticibacter amylolyticus]
MKRIVIILLSLLAVCQFFRPERNSGITGGPDAIQNVTQVPDTVMSVLRNACYDCHSNRTEYPWYTNIQPVGWWLADHVKEGKGELNFDAFGTYSPEKALHKLDESEEVIRKGEMPLKSYLLLHPKAKLSDKQKEMIFNWISEVKK